MNIPSKNLNPSKFHNIRCTSQGQINRGQRGQKGQKGAISPPPHPYQEASLDFICKRIDDFKIRIIVKKNTYLITNEYEIRRLLLIFFQRNTVLIHLSSFLYFVCNLISLLKYPRSPEV